jgi:hypothetical protein
MTEERYKALMDDETATQGNLTDAEIKEGWHFCCEFDGLLIGPGMGEMEHCHCFEPIEPPKTAFQMVRETMKGEE